MRNVLICIVGVCLMLLAVGCPKGQPAGEQTTTPTVTGNNGEQVVAEATNAEPSQETETEQNESHVSETTPPQPQTGKVEITGTWLALFGRGDQGVHEQAYANGHKLQFNPDGTLLLTMIKNGEPDQKMPGTYRIVQDRLEWSYSLTAALDTGAVDVAPMGMGRDEEIGFLNKEKEGMGRDEEIGLLGSEKEGMGRDIEIGLTGDGKQAKSATHTEDLRIVMDGPFMALTDDHGQIYVYGNESAVINQPLPNHEWSGTVGGKAITVDFTESNGSVTGRLGDYGGVFNGQLTGGFIAGRIEGQQRLSLAALAISKDGSLSGVLLTDPYVKLDPQFDFNPVP